LFSWDGTKNQANRKKHGISFEAARLVFNDPFHISRMERVEQGEQRWQTIGMAGGVLLLLVAHTWEEDATGELQIRIISARRANKLERTIYEEGP
jgi:uncharacterized protein